MTPLTTRPSISTPTLTRIHRSVRRSLTNAQMPSAALADASDRRRDATIATVRPAATATDPTMLASHSQMLSSPTVSYTHLTLPTIYSV